MREEGRDEGVGDGRPWCCPGNARGLRASASFSGFSLVSNIVQTPWGGWIPLTFLIVFPSPASFTPVTAMLCSSPGATPGTRDACVILCSWWRRFLSL